MEGSLFVDNFQQKKNFIIFAPLPTRHHQIDRADPVSESCTERRPCHGNKRQLVVFFNSKYWNVLCMVAWLTWQHSSPQWRQFLVSKKINNAGPELSQLALAWLARKWCQKKPDLTEIPADRRTGADYLIPSLPALSQPDIYGSSAHYYHTVRHLHY